MREIPPFRLVPEPLNDEAATLPPFKWAGPEPGTRHGLGGRPDAIQPLEYPNCPQCGERMTFYGQLDSINDEFVVGVFVCFDCLAASATIQSA